MHKLNFSDGLNIILLVFNIIVFIVNLQFWNKLQWTEKYQGHCEESITHIRDSIHVYYDSYFNASTSVHEVKGALTFVPMGRLGNQMYEYAAAIGIASRNNRYVMLPQGHDLRSCFKGLSCKEGHITGQEVHPADLFYEPVRHLASDTQVLRSQLQSWKYFGHMYRELRKEFTLHDEFNKFAEDFLTNYSTSTQSPPTFVCVQIRRTDFVGQYGHLINPITRKYIQTAMDLFQNYFENVVFVVVSDDSKWSIRNINKSKYNTVFSLNHSQCEDFTLLCHCNHSIITGGSSFGWWGAFLANGLTTYFPGWLRNGAWYNLPIREDDVYLPRWLALPRI